MKLAEASEAGAGKVKAGDRACLRAVGEAADQGAKVPGLAVHPYISGVPHRAGSFGRTWRI